LDKKSLFVQPQRLSQLNDQAIGARSLHQSTKTKSLEDPSLVKRQRRFQALHMNFDTLI
jgi:hypothetical protein